MPRDITVVRTFATEVEAQIAQAALAAEGIPSIILRDNAGGMLPVMQVLYHIRLAVRTADLEAARRRLDEGAPLPDVTDEAAPGQNHGWHPEVSGELDDEWDDEDDDVEPWKRDDDRDAE